MFNALLSVTMATLATAENVPVPRVNMVRLVERLRGAVMVQFIRPQMSEDQVRRLLGPPDSLSCSGWMTVWYYPEHGIQVFWSTPVRIYAPAERVGPMGMTVLRVMPSMWVRGIALLLPLMEYSPPTILQEVRWVGFE